MYKYNYIIILTKLVLCSCCYYNLLLSQIEYAKLPGIENLLLTKELENSVKSHIITKSNI